MKAQPPGIVITEMHFDKKFGKNRLCRLATSREQLYSVVSIKRSNYADSFLGECLHTCMTHQLIIAVCHAAANDAINASFIS
jgi:hypothetical protein